MIPFAVIDIVVVVVIIFVFVIVFDAVRCVHGWFALLMIPFPLMRNEDGQHSPTFSVHQKISNLYPKPKMARYKRFCFLPLLISQIVLQGLARSWQARLPEAGRIKQSCKVSQIPNDQEHRPCGDLALKIQFFKQSCKVSKILNDQEHLPCGDLAFKVTR